MKKIALLLFTLLCVSALNGMENPESDNYKGLGGLSPEIQVTIISYLKEYNNLENIINAIKATSLVDKELNEIVNGEYGNQKGFTKLLITLLNKFNGINKPSHSAIHLYTREMVEKFRTPTAKKYLQILTTVSEELKDILRIDESLAHSLNPIKISQFVKNGDNINFFNIYGTTLLLRALEMSMPVSSIKLLLEAGANPNATDNKNKGVFEYLDSGYPQKFEIYRIQKPKIKQLLEDAKKTTLGSVDFL